MQAKSKSKSKSKPRPALRAVSPRTEESKHTGRIGCEGSTYAPFIILIGVYV